MKTIMEQNQLNKRLFIAMLDSKLSEDDKLRKIRELIGNGADINAEFETTETLLHFAIRYKYKEIFTFLLKAKAKIDIADYRGDTAENLLSLPKNKVMQQLYDDLYMDADDIDQVKRPKRQALKETDDYTYLDPVTKKIVRVEKQQEEDSDFNNLLEEAVYEVQLFALFTNRAFQNGYKLSVITEVDDPQKFDDFLFEYGKGPNGDLSIRYLKIVYDQNEGRKITLADLVDTSDSADFGLVKYFETFRKLNGIAKYNLGLGNQPIEEFVVTTNIDIASLGHGVRLEEIKKMDVILRNRFSKKYRLAIEKDHQLYVLLRENTAERTLARLLLKLALASPNENNKISLDYDIFRSYDQALANNVIDVEKGAFQTEFIAGGLSDNVMHFRNVLKEEFLKLKPDKTGKSERYFRNEIAKMKLNLSSGFGRIYTLKKDININPKELATDMVTAIKIARNNIIEFKASDSLNQLAGYVIVENNNKLGFSSLFIEDSTVLPNSLKALKYELLKQLSVVNMDFNLISNYEIKVTESYSTCEEGQQFGHKWKDLPVNKITDAEIQNFFDKLRFSVKQPSETKLTTILKDELNERTSLTLLRPDLIEKSFERKIVQWFLEKTAANRGKVFEAKFITSLDHRLRNLITNGVQQSYKGKMKATGIRFLSTYKPIKELMTRSPLRRVLYVRVNDRLLGSSMALNTLEEAQDLGYYDGKDQVIFVRQKTLLTEKKMLLESFASESGFNLLVIEGGTTDDQQAEQSVSNDIADIVEKNPEKKVLVVAESSSTLPKYLKEASGKLYEEQSTSLSFGDLNDQSQQRILENEVNFQGYPVKAIDIFPSKEMSQTNLRRLIKGKAIVGKELRKFSKFYIPQTITRNLAVDSQVFLDNKVDIFTVSGIDLNHLKTFVGDERVRDFSFGSTDNEIRYIALRPGDFEAQFEYLVKIFSQKNVNIHWFHYNTNEAGETFYWQKTKGDVGVLVRYANMHNNEGFKSFLDENEFLTFSKVEGGVTVISGPTGYGKQDMLDRFALTIKSENPSHWVIRVNLNDCVKVLEEEMEYRRNNNGFPTFYIGDKDSVGKFLIEKMLRKNEFFSLGPADIEIFKNIFSSRFNKKTSILLDGYSDLTPEHRQIVKELMMGLKKLFPKFLISSSTPKLSHELVKVTQKQFYRIEPLSESKQVTLLAEHWKHNPSVSGNIDFEQAAKDLIVSTRKAANDDRITETPTILEILASLHSDQLKEISTRNLNDLPPTDKYSIHNAYVRKELINYVSTEGTFDNTRLQDIISVNERHTQLLDDYGRLALYSLADQRDISTYFGQDLVDFVRGAKTRWIPIYNLPQIVDQRANFLSNSMRHFFHAEYHANQLVSVNPDYSIPNRLAIRYLFEVVLLDPRFSGTRIYFDGFLGRNKLDKMKIIQYYGEALSEAWHARKEDLLTPDGETVVHVAAQEGHSNIVKLIIKGLRDKPAFNSLIVDAQSSSGATALHYAAKSNDLRSLEALVEAFHSIEVYDYQKRTPLHYAVEGGQIENVQSLLHYGANMHASDASKISSLQYAAIQGNLEILREFLTRHDWQLYEDNILHLAAEHGHYDIVEYLIENGLVNINKQDYNGKTPLDYANEHSHGRIVSYLKRNSVLHECFPDLIQLGIDCLISKEDVDDISVSPKEHVKDIKIDSLKFWKKYHNLEHGLKRNQLIKLASELVSMKNWPQVISGVDSEDVFRKINRYNKFEKFILNRGAQITEQRDKTGYTILHALAEFGVISSNEESVSHFVHSKDEYGNTPLHYAAESGNRPAVETLIEHTAKVTETNINGDTPLHFAARTNNRRVVEFLLQLGASQFTKNSAGETPIMLAAKHADLNMFKYLLNENYDADMLKRYIAESGDVSKLKELKKIAITKQDKFMLEAAAKYGHIEMVKYLKETIKMSTPAEAYYAAARAGSLEIMKYLPYATASPITENTIKSGNMDLIKWLFEEKKVPLTDKYGPQRNLLYAALESGNMETVEWLHSKNVIDIHATDQLGENLAHAAAKSHNIDALRWVQKNGIDLTAKNKEGKTTLQSAIEVGNVVGAEWLSKEGVAFSYDYSGNSVFDYAKVKQHPEMLTWLQYINAATHIYDSSSIVSKEDWNRVAKVPVDDVSKIEIEAEKLEEYLKTEREVSKIVAILDIAQKYGNTAELSKSARIRKYFNQAHVVRRLHRLQKFSDRLNLAATGKNIIGDLIDGDLGGLATNTALLAGTYLTPKVQDWLIRKGDKYIERGARRLGRGLKCAAPFIGRATNAAVIKDLVDQIESYKEGNTDALVPIVGDSTVLVIDTTMIGVELLEVFGVVSGVSSVVGPFVAAIDVAIAIGMDIYNSVRTVQHIEEDIPLTAWEALSTGIRAFFTAEPEQYITDLQEEERANSNLTVDAVIFLRKSPYLTKYIFSSVHKIEDKMVAYTDNVFDFTHKVDDIKWTRTIPKRIVGTNRFCLPKGDFITPSKETYYCVNTIGVELTDRKKKPANQTVLLRLGEGQDSGNGFPNEGNIFVIARGNKNIVGGDKDDIFYIGKEFTSGFIDGGKGLNTLDFAAYNGNEVVHLNPSLRLTAENTVLNMNSIQRVVGRTNKTDIFEVECGVQFIESRGGPDSKNPDRITIKDSHLQCDHDLILNIAANTNVKNSVYGNVRYNIFRGNGDIDMHLDYKSLGHHDKKTTISANYTLIELEEISRTIVSNSTLKATFLFKSEEKHKNEKLKVNMLLDNEHALIGLSDNTIVKFNSTQIYAVQYSTDSPSAIIHKYKPAAKRLKLLLMANSLKEKASITINYEDGREYNSTKTASDNIKIIPTDPTVDNHILSGIGPNLYEITPPSPIDLLTTSENTYKTVYIYNNDDNSAKGNSVYLKNYVKAIVAQRQINPEYHCTNSGIDIIITLQDGNIILGKIVLKDALLNKWYEKVELIGKNAPLRVKRENQDFVLEPLPLHFDNKTNYAIVRADDIERHATIEFDKNSSGYEFYKLNDDLVITNHFAVDVPADEQFAISLIHFYRKDESELHTLKFAFKDERFTLEEKKNIVESPEDFRVKMRAYTNGFVELTSDFNLSSANSAGALYSPINSLVSWVKESGHRLASYISEAISFTNSWSKPSALTVEASGENDRYVERNMLPQFDCNQSLILADFLVRKYTKQAPYNSKEETVNYLDMQGYSLRLVSDLEEIIGKISAKDTKIETEFDPIKLQRALIEELVNGTFKSVENLLLNSVQFFPPLDQELIAYLKKSVNEIVSGESSPLINHVKQTAEVRSESENQFYTTPSIPEISHSAILPMVSSHS